MTFTLFVFLKASIVTPRRTPWKVGQLIKNASLHSDAKPMNYALECDIGKQVPKSKFCVVISSYMSCLFSYCN